MPPSRGSRSALQPSASHTGISVLAASPRRRGTCCAGFPAGRSIEDYDLVYYDAADLSREMEARQLERAVELLGDLNVQVDVKNEARVHLWYESRFGHA